MSATTNATELEAALAEHELDDDEAAKVRELVEQGGQLASALEFVLGQREQEPEPDEPEPPTEPPTGEPSRQQLAALDREQARHEKRVREVMGAFVAGFEACGECSGVGLVPPGPKPQRHDWFIACETCAGFGQVLTGSLRAGNESRDCPTCRGRGYLEKLTGQGASMAPEGIGQGQPVPLVAPPAAATVLEGPQPRNGDGGYGVPSWMGDPAIGR